MKKVIALLFTMVLIVSLAACSVNTDTTNQTAQTDSVPSNKSTDSAADDNSRSSAAEDEYPITGNIVYFKDALNWSNGGKTIYIHYWSSSNYNMVTWPGKAMKKLENDVYSYELPDGVEYVIFNNNGDKDTQTRDVIYDGSVRKFMASKKQDEVKAHYATDWDGNEIDSNAIDDNSNDDPKEKKIEQAANYVEDVLGGDYLAKYKKNGVDSYSWDTSKSDRPAQDMAIDVTFDGYHVTNGFKVSELIEGGFVLGSADKEIEAGYEVTPFNCENKVIERRLYLDLTNTSNSTKEAKDYEISGINFLENCSGVDYKGLTKGSTLTEAIEKLGIPSGGIYVGCIDNENPYIQLSYGYAREGTLQISFRYNPTSQSSSLYDLDFS